MPPHGNQRIMAALVEKLADLLASPDSVNSGVRDARDSTFVSFAAAGMPVDAAALDFGDLSTQEQLCNSGRFSELVNSIPDAAGFHGPGGTKIWDVYERALAPLEPPAGELSNREAVLLAKAQGFLSFEVPLKDSDTGKTSTTLAPTPQYEAYSERLTAYGASLLKYNAALQEAKRAHATPAGTRALKAAQDVVRAYQDWGSAGYRDYVDQANEIISTIVAKAPPSVYDALRHAFEMSLRHVPGTGRTYYPTFVYPRNVLDPAYDDYWTPFVFSEQDVYGYTQAAASKHGREITESYAGVTVSAAASDADRATTHQIDSRGLSIGCELLQVPLVRPWFTRWILSSRGWHVPAGKEKTTSNGAAQPCESISLSPVSIVLARNLKLTLTASKWNESVLKTVSSCARASYGSFALKADASSSLGASRHAPNVTSSGLSVSGAQIVAVVCEVFPKSPVHERPARPAQAGPPVAGTSLVC